MGEMLSPQYFDPELYFDPHVPVPLPTGACPATLQGLTAAPSGASDAGDSGWVAGLENGYWERVGVKVLTG